MQRSVTQCKPQPTILDQAQPSSSLPRPRSSSAHPITTGHPYPFSSRPRSKPSAPLQFSQHLRAKPKPKRRTKLVVQNPEPTPSPEPALPPPQLKCTAPDCETSLSPVTPLRPPSAQILPLSPRAARANVDSPATPVTTPASVYATPAAFSSTPANILSVLAAVYATPAIAPSTPVRTPLPSTPGRVPDGAYQLPVLSFSPPALSPLSFIDAIAQDGRSGGATRLNAQNPGARKRKAPPEEPAEPSTTSEPSSPPSTTPTPEPSIVSDAVLGGLVGAAANAALARRGRKRARTGGYDGGVGALSVGGGVAPDTCTGPSADARGYEDKGSARRRSLRTKRQARARASLC
ncbi:hypothetical protein K488DRAFT_88597 [Vararia minispora EC-137]|uniref:Uncharacterized protein n=1 Tax=Vararia minispora EC-137 TaxID=1314806 RepID=A0ACB8QDB3_9AGAM|nr:hypothetical protein K488DRAFT_88597 [Vararia minispora EC-137]